MERERERERDRQGERDEMIGVLGHDFALKAILAGYTLG